MEPRSHRPLTPKLRALAETDRHSRPPVGRLTPAEIETLTAIARGATDFDVPVSVPAALAALAAGAPPATALAVLSDMLSDSDAPAVDRIMAARRLAQIATPDAERALLQRISEPDPRVLQDVLAGLGSFAGPSAERALDAVAAATDPALHRQLLLARVLIGYRSGRGDTVLPPAAAVDAPATADGAMSVEVQQKTHPDAAADLRRLRGWTYGIRLADNALRLRCGRTESTIFLNDELGRSTTMINRIFQRPWIAGIVAQWLPRRERLYTRHVILTRPANGRLHIDIARRDGEAVYAGTATLLGPSVEFEILAVDRPGTAPTRVAGLLTATGVELRTGVTAVSRVAPRTSAPTTPPPTTTPR